MPPTAYFDSALWIAVLVGEPTAVDVDTLIGEIKKDKGRVLTSIMTLTEITVRAYRDDPAKVIECPPHREHGLVLRPTPAPARPRGECQSAGRDHGARDSGGDGHDRRSGGSRR